MNQKIKVLLTLPIFLLAFSFMDQSKANEEINIGQMAPNFNLQDQNGKWHTLNDYKGQWVVLFFYPKDGTPGCTTEACSFRDNIFEFYNDGIERKEDLIISSQPLHFAFNNTWGIQTLGISGRFLVLNSVSPWKWYRIISSMNNSEV